MKLFNTYGEELYEAEGTIKEVVEKAVAEKIDLSEVYLHGVNLSYACLMSGKFKGADFREAFLGRTCLAYADLEEADFRGADVGFADFRGADIRGAMFAKAKIGKIFLKSVDVGVNLTGVEYEGLKLNGHSPLVRIEGLGRTVVLLEDLFISGLDVFDVHRIKKEYIDDEDFLLWWEQYGDAIKTMALRN